VFPNSSVIVATWSVNAPRNEDFLIIESYVELYFQSAADVQRSGSLNKLIGAPDSVLVAISPNVVDAQTYTFRYPFSSAKLGTMVN
jgi:hypothetical protein